MTKIKLSDLEIVFNYQPKRVRENLRDFAIQSNASHEVFLQKGNCLYVFNTDRKNVFENDDILFDDAAVCYVRTEKNYKNCSYDPVLDEFEIWLDDSSDYVKINDILVSASTGRPFKVVNRSNNGRARSKEAIIERGCLCIL